MYHKVDNTKFIWPGGRIYLQPLNKTQYVPTPADGVTWYHTTQNSGTPGPLIKKMVSSKLQKLPQLQFKFKPSFYRTAIAQLNSTEPVGKKTIWSKYWRNKLNGYSFYNPKYISSH